MDYIQRESQFARKQNLKIFDAWPIVRAMRPLLIIVIGALGLAAQDSLSRQVAAISRQRAALSAPGSSLQRQGDAVARQSASAKRVVLSAQDVAVSAASGPWIPRLEEPACESLDEGVARARFQSEERRKGLPTGLLEAVARQESALYPCAVSRAGALGLMQLMPATADQFGVADPMDPWESLQAGSQFLKLLLDRYGGDLSLALGAYNAGPARVDLYGGIPPIAETQNYVDSVLSRMRRITASDNPSPP